MRNWLLFIALAASHLPAYASFNGQVVTAEQLFPNTATVVPGAFVPVQAAVGPGVEFNNVELPGGTPLIAANLSANNILLTNVHPLGAQVTFAVGAFNGYRFSDANGTIPDITGVAINGATNLLGFDATRIFFDTNSIRVNILPNVVWSPTEIVSLDVTFAAPTVTPTATLTPTPTATPTPTPTATPTMQSMLTPSATPTVMPAAAPTDTIPTLDWRGLALLIGLLLLFGVVALRRLQT